MSTILKGEGKDLFFLVFINLIWGGRGDKKWGKIVDGRHLQH